MSLIETELFVKDFTTPSVLYENEDYAICFKPGGLATAPLYENEPNTLLSFFCSYYKKANLVVGKKKSIEKGLLHRLDTQTKGLVLIAKNQTTYDFLEKEQSEGRFSKTYKAYCNETQGTNHTSFMHFSEIKNFPHFITSKFRPFGPGGKKVKPVFENNYEYSKLKGKLYTTKLISIDQSGKVFVAIANLVLGYRHQIRSHLLSIGLPIIEDSLYNLRATTNDLQLYATELSFFPQKENHQHLFKIKNI